MRRHISDDTIRKLGKIIGKHGIVLLKIRFLGEAAGDAGGPLRQWAVGSITLFTTLCFSVHAAKKILGKEVCTSDLSHEVIPDCEEGNLVTINVSRDSGGMYFRPISAITTACFLS